MSRSGWALKAPEQLYELGYRCQVASDIAPSVVETMRERTAAMRDGLEWVVENALCMPNQPDGSYDAILDKATADAVACAGQMPRLLAEAARVLRPDGVYVLISSLESAKRYFAAPAWQPTVCSTHASRRAPDGALEGECWVHVARKTELGQI